jgi:hypothetical protein
MSVVRGIVDDVWVSAHYYDRRSGRSNAVC